MKDIKSFNELLEISNNNGLSIVDVFIEVEAFMTDLSIDKLRKKMLIHLQDMKESVKRGLNCSEKSLSGLSGDDSIKVTKRYNENTKLPFSGLLGKVLNYSIAVMEENQRMGKIVACPTAGSCGIVPSTIIAFAEEYNFTQEKQINALFIAAGIGKIVAQSVALAGAVAGCQAECGVGSAMAAGAVTYLMDGSNQMIINSAALALKNTLGLVCDPVAGLVEVPCIKRNGFHSIHSVVASEMALAGIESVIPMDEIVVAMKQIGNIMSPSLKESSEGGLAVTETGNKINKKLQLLWNS